jgi:hypothetical protein
MLEGPLDISIQREGDFVCVKTLRDGEDVTSMFIQAYRIPDLIAALKQTIR